GGASGRCRLSGCGINYGAWIPAIGAIHEGRSNSRRQRAQEPGDQLADATKVDAVHRAEIVVVSKLLLHTQSELLNIGRGCFVVYDCHAYSEGTGTAREWVSKRRGAGGVLSSSQETVAEARSCRGAGARRRAAGPGEANDGKGPAIEQLFQKRRL